MNGEFLIIHASDLHHHPTSAYDPTDRKVALPIQSLAIDRFWQSLLTLPKPPDFIVFSGDITLRGAEEGHAEFEEKLTLLCKKFGWDDRSRVVIVPGNHDVKWQIGAVYSEEERYRSFAAHTNGARVPMVPGAPKGAEPYSLDRENKILVYAINSSRYCGVRETDSPEWHKVEQALASITDPALRKSAEKWAAERRLHDVAYVDPAQLAELATNVRRVSPDDGWIRIAVLHHHLIPLSGGVPPELKTFETVINAGEVLEALHAAHFSLVLHGHKHIPRVQYHLDHRRGTTLAVACAPTAGGAPSQSGNGYYAIRLSRQANAVDVSIETRHQSEMASSVERIVLDQPTAVSWQQVHMKWRREGLYGSDSGTALIEDILKSDLPAVHRIQEASTTKSLGDFPGFCSRFDDLIKSAKKSLHIACDFPGYAVFSAPRDFDDYRTALFQAAKDTSVLVEMRYLARSAQAALHAAQLPNYHARTIGQGAVPLMRLRALNERLESLGKPPLKVNAPIEVYQETLRAIHAAIDAEFSRSTTRIGVAHLRVAPPVHVWIVDETRAIFAIPGAPGREPDGKGSYWTRENGFITDDSVLVRRLMMAWRFYDSHYVSREREEGTPLALRKGQSATESGLPRILSARVGRRSRVVRSSRRPPQ